jgi:hypothetical protein
MGMPDITAASAVHFYLTPKNLLTRIGDSDLDPIAPFTNIKLSVSSATQYLYAVVNAERRHRVIVKSSRGSWTYSAVWMRVPAQGQEADLVMKGHSENHTSA